MSGHDPQDEYGNIRDWGPSSFAKRYHDHLASQRPGGGPTPPDKPYTLFRGRIGRLVGDFASEAEALEAVLPDVEANGDRADLVLMHVTTRRTSPYVAAGEALIGLATRARAAKLPVG